jgi:hypothetical protein
VRQVKNAPLRIVEAGFLSVYNIAEMKLPALREISGVPSV